MVRLQKMLIDWFGIERLLSVSGGSMGGMQALEWAVSYPDAWCRAIPIAGHHAAQRAADRLQRSGPAGDHGRSRLERAATTTAAAAGARAGGGAHGGAHHLHERRFDAREVRAAAARQGELRLRFRRGFRSGKLPALPRQRVRQPLRRQLVSVHHQGDGLLRSVERPRLLAAGVRSGAGAVPGDQLQFGLALSELPIAGDRARAARAQLRRGLLELPSNYGHDAFLVDVAEQTELVRGFLASTF